MSGTQTPTPRFRLDENKLDDWGKLVKSWATRQDYVQVDFDWQPPRRYPAPPPPATTTLDVDSLGALKPWALPPMSAVAIPGTDNTFADLPGAVALTKDEFIRKLDAAGVVPTEMPEQYTHVIVVQGDVSTMVIRLPPKDTLQGSEDDLIKAMEYPFQKYYAKYFVVTEPTPPVGASVKPTSPVTPAGIMELHAYRIGDYTMSNCD